jgi:hypothetical protein
MTVQTLKTGDEISLVRRRYGSLTYTWVSVRLCGQWVSLGDPWPCITPKKTEVLTEIERAKRGRS